MSTPDAGGLEPSEPSAAARAVAVATLLFRLGARSPKNTCGVAACSVRGFSAGGRAFGAGSGRPAGRGSGYNVTLTSWPELELPDQRRRLVDALAELASRTSTSVEARVRRGRGRRLAAPPARRKGPNEGRVLAFGGGSRRGDHRTGSTGSMCCSPSSSPPTTAGSAPRSAGRGPMLISVAQLMAVLGTTAQRRALTGRGCCDWAGPPWPGRPLVRQAAVVRQAALTGPGCSGRAGLLWPGRAALAGPGC